MQNLTHPIYSGTHEILSTCSFVNFFHDNFARYLSFSHLCLRNTKLSCSIFNVSLYVEPFIKWRRSFFHLQNLGPNFVVMLYSFFSVCRTYCCAICSAHLEGHLPLAFKVQKLVLILIRNRIKAKSSSCHFSSLRWTFSLLYPGFE
jgi:hypothetical protein